jgi:alpha-beta hydrolase superfamily lysophospholipase
VTADGAGADAAPLALPDGAVLRGRAWPARGAPRGTVVVVHGLGEHVGRHAGVAAFLAAQGFDVLGFDQRGHGRSDGPRGRIPRDEALLEDLAAVLDRARAAHRGGALLLLGHSLGGAVAARFVAEALAPAPRPWSRPVDGLVLSSPALKTHAGPATRAAARVLGALGPDLALGNGLSPDWLSRDPAVAAAYRADPLVHDRIAPRLARFLFAAGPAVLAAAPRWRVLTVLLWAGADRCVDPAGSAAFRAAAPPGTVAGTAFPTLLHEIFHAPERERVFAALADALGPRFDNRASRPPAPEPTP